MSRIGDFGRAELIAEVEERAMDRRHEDRIVCPICGLVWEDGKTIATTHSLSVWVERGYSPIACPDCVVAGRTVGFSGEFEFAEGV